jgi:hypothetical protein
MGTDAKTHRLYTLLQQLERARIHYTLTRVRDDTVMIPATVPGRRTRSRCSQTAASNVRMGGQELVDDLIANYSDAQSPPPNRPLERSGMNASPQTEPASAGRSTPRR